MRTIDDRLKALAEPKRPKRANRPKKKNVDIDVTKLNDLCSSELVAVAHIVGYPEASRLMPNDDLVSLILGEVSRESLVDPFSEVRDRTAGYVESGGVSAAWAECNLICDTCPNNLIVDCYSTNRDLLEEGQ